jgi:hypothetical protein
MCTRPLPGVLLIVVSVTADMYNTSDNYFTILIWIGCAALAAGAYVSFFCVGYNTLRRAHSRLRMPPTCICLRFVRSMHVRSMHVRSMHVRSMYLRFVASSQFARGCLCAFLFRVKGLGTKTLFLAGCDALRVCLVDFFSFRSMRVCLELFFLVAVCVCRAFFFLFAVCASVLTLCASNCICLCMYSVS